MTLLCLSKIWLLKITTEDMVIGFMFLLSFYFYSLHFYILLVSLVAHLQKIMIRMFKYLRNRYFFIIKKKHIYKKIKANIFVKGYIIKSKFRIT